MAETVRISGLRELGRALQELGAKMQRKVIGRATGKAAKIVKTAVTKQAAQQPTLADRPYAHDGVTYQPGHIARNVVAKKLRQATPGVSEHIVAVRSNKANGYAGAVASLNEFGTVRMAAQPFMRPGFEGSKQAAVEAMIAELRAAIERARNTDGGA